MNVSYFGDGFLLLLFISKMKMLIYSRLWISKALTNCILEYIGVPFINHSRADKKWSRYGSSKFIKICFQILDICTDLDD